MFLNPVEDGRGVTVGTVDLTFVVDEAMVTALALMPVPGDQFSHRHGLYEYGEHDHWLEEVFCNQDHATFVWYSGE